MISVALNYDVLAIRCIDNYVLVGVGNQVHAYSNLTLKREVILNTLHHDNIHEIVKSGKHMIIYGGRCLSIFKLQTINDKIKFEIKSNHQFNDWIIGAEFFSNKNYENLHILFAHNNLYLYNTSTRKHQNIWCEEKCILYSGCILVEEPNVAIIFSGTVFQEILIWKVNEKDSGLLEVPVCWRLKGHKGVIFSIFYDPIKELITSTSDDRTVRLWEIVHKRINKFLIQNNWWNDCDNVDINLKTTMFGHTYRVWKSMIVNDIVISIGEDSQICFWTLEGNLLNKITAHDGATIWSIDVSLDKSAIYTGGANGGVNLWPLLPNSTETSSLIPKLTFTKNVLPKYVGYLRSGALIVFIDNGELFIYRTSSSTLQYSLNLPQYKNYCLMQISPNRSKIVFAARDGNVGIFEEEKNGKLIEKISQKILDSQILSIHWLNDQQLLICGDNGHLEMREIIENYELIRKLQFILPSSRERWTTSAIIVECFLVCGDRGGNIHVYSMNAEKNVKNHQKHPQQTLPKVHGRLGVQSFELTGRKLASTGRDGSLRYYSIRSSRNKNNLNNSVQPLAPLNCKKMPMEWVSKILKTHDDIYVLGFKEVEFMIYSNNLQRLIVKFTCGGGHRSWDCIFFNGYIHFTCIRNKQVYTLNSISYTFSKTLVSGFHTKEIHAIKLLDTNNNLKHVNKNNKNIILVSASEDCTLRLTDLRAIDSSSPPEYQLSCLDTIVGHISNVKCLDILNYMSDNGETSYLIFSGGGRAQLKVWQVQLDAKNYNLTSSDLYIRELTSFMLYGTDRDRRNICHDQGEEYFIDPETRFMDINAHQNILDIFLFIACSDGFIRICIYNIIHNNLYLATVIPYYNRCIIKIQSFVYKDEVILLSMATDGFINLWEMNSMMRKNSLDKNCDNIESRHNDVEKSNLQPFKRWHAHQSGINSYDLRQYNEQFYLLTGGDDNKINFSCFTIFIDDNRHFSADITAEWSSSSTHYAQITGVKFYDNNKFISVAIDQRIITYNYTHDIQNSTLSVNPLHKITFTSVADVHGLTLVNNINDDNNENHKLICIYGRGTEVILLENDA